MIPKFKLSRSSVCFSLRSLRVPRGIFDFSQGFSPRLDYTRYRNNIYTPKHAIWLFSKCNFLVPFLSSYISLYSSRFFLKRFPLFDWMQRCRGKFYNVSKSDTVPKAPIQLFSSFICFLLQRLSPRSDPFVAVHRNEKQTFMQFRNGCLDSEKEMEFLCRPAETTCTVEWGGNLENGNSVSFDFFQRGRYRVSAKGIVDSRNCLDGG